MINWTVADDDFSDDQTRRVVMAALATINLRYQEAFSLRYLSRLPNESAAERLAVSSAVMAVTYARAVKALQRALPGGDLPET